MFVSAFDVFKISVGPSSSHTMGPMIAAHQFLVELGQRVALELSGQVTLKCSLHGSLAFTGEGHGTQRAILAGLLGLLPDNYDPEKADVLLADFAQSKTLELSNRVVVNADPATLIFSDRKNRLPQHPNGLMFELVSVGGTSIFSEKYFSVGGGFVLTEAEMASHGQKIVQQNVPYPFSTSSEMLAQGQASGLSIAQMKRENERVGRERSEVSERLQVVWDVMNNCIERGMALEGELPGGLRVKRRAKFVSERLTNSAGRNSAPLHQATDWLAAYAMAVNEENAAGGQVVTAPTNGAAGVIPAVLRYYLDHVPGADRKQIPEMLLTASAIGGLIKSNASISGAEVGCQGEVGSASAMAAAALCAALGGSNEQVENAAEIALEHHLGMTCDPVRGLVQVPCIERNGMGAVKAVAAASLALAGDGEHIVSLDACIETMRQTGRDMDERYKETSLGGLSVNLPEC